jgi:hypothetical protein
MRGEIEGQRWGEKAHIQAKKSHFYEYHTTRNRLLNGRPRRDELDAWENIAKIIFDVGKGHQNVSQALVDRNKSNPLTQSEMKGLRNAVSDSKLMLPAARDLLIATRQAHDELVDRKPEHDAAQRLGFRVIKQWKENVETQLNDCLKERRHGMRFYILFVTPEGSDRSHVIGIVSTRSGSFLSPNGHLFCFDPNLNRVSRWKSPSKLIAFLRECIKRTYPDYNSLKELAIQAGA